MKMAKRRAKKTVKKTEMLPAINENSNEDAKEPQIEAQEDPFVDIEGIFFTFLASFFLVSSSCEF